MKNKSKLFGMYLPIYIIALLTAVTFRSVALFVSYNAVTHYFDDKILIGIADYTVIFSSLFLFTYTFTARRDIKLIPNFTGPATYIPTSAVFVALVFILKSITEAYSDVNETVKYLEAIGSASALQQAASQKILLFTLGASFVFAILSIVHFALTTLIESQSSTKRAYFGLATVAFFCFYAAYIYFNAGMPINAPSKVLDQIAFLFFAAFFLFEARLSIGREKWRGYIAFGFIASLLAGYTSIPSMIYFFGTGTIAANNIFETALSLALFIFITARVLLTGELVEDKPSETVEKLVAFAENREKLITPISEFFEVIDITGEELVTAEGRYEDENQITIDDMGILSIETNTEPVYTDGIYIDELPTQEIITTEETAIENTVVEETEQLTLDTNIELTSEQIVNQDTNIAEETATEEVKE